MIEALLIGLISGITIAITSGQLNTDVDPDSDFH